MRALVRIAWPAMIAFGAAFTVVCLNSGDVYGWIFRTAKRFGAKPVFESGAKFGSIDGRVFMEGTLAGWAGNVAYAHAGWVLPVLAGLVSGGVVYAVCAGWLGHTRLFAGRGVTRCGRCGYELRGLREPVCAECGTSI